MHVQLQTLQHQDKFSFFGHEKFNLRDSKRKPCAGQEIGHWSAPKPNSCFTSGCVRMAAVLASMTPSDRQLQLIRASTQSHHKLHGGRGFRAVHKYAL